MDVDFRTILRAFLIVGGLALLLVGILDGSTTNAAIGAIAVLVGAVGFWFDL